MVTIVGLPTGTERTCQEIQTSQAAQLLPTTTPIAVTLLSLTQAMAIVVVERRAQPILTARKHNCWSGNGNRKTLSGSTVDSCAAATYTDSDCGYTFEFDSNNNFCGCGTNANSQCDEESDSTREWSSSNTYTTWSSGSGEFAPGGNADCESSFVAGLANKSSLPIQYVVV